MNKKHRRNWLSHSNLNDEVANVFLKLRYVLVEADQAFDEHFNLSTATAKRAHQKTTVLRPFFRDHPGEPVPEENFWTLWCRGRLTEADTLTIRLGATPSALTSAHLHHSPTTAPQ